MQPEENHELGLVTSCSRFPTKLPETSQNVAQKVLQKQSKVAFCNESSQKLLEKKQDLFCFFLLFGLMQKLTNCTKKRHFRAL